MIPDWVKSYVSIPYEDVDCYGMVRLVYKEQYYIDLEPIHSRDKLDNWDVVFDGHGEPAVREGDVLMFKDDPVNRHVGIVLDETFMLHSIRGVNSCVERWNRLNWRGRLVKVYRHHSRR